MLHGVVNRMDGLVKHAFPPEMMQERERQLVLALLDCAGVCYDINLTKDRMIGRPVQILAGKTYSILDQIGKPENCRYSEVMQYWLDRMPKEEYEAFAAFADVRNIRARYAAGERLIAHRFWTVDFMGNMMLAQQKIRLYEDVTNGDLLGLVYITNDREQYTLQQKEAALLEKYRNASNRVLFWESIGVNIPGGYHRCSTEDGFRLRFVSDSFLEIVGWSREELATELGNQFLELVAPEDRDFFMSHEPALVKNGRIDLAYRIRRKDGTRRWVQDATVRTEQDGETFYQCTLADITDYVERLNEEKARAEESSLAKTTFLFNASHDIRTPMNAIQGFARIIEENAEDPKVVRDAVRKILQSGDTLMTLLNDVLELSRIERGKEEVEQQPLDMEAHAGKLYEMFAAEMKQAEIRFEMENEVCHPHVLGDDLKLTRIAMNLLSNAKKFTPRGGRVVFGIKETPIDEERAAYSLFVRDTGIGMSHEFQKRAFEQFERERSSTESGISGSGLGLAIIKRLCDLMGGECRLCSALGSGTEITVTIPLRLAREMQQAETTGEENTNLSGRHVLLVEDNEFNREIARYMLESLGMTVDEAENGFEAVELLLHAGLCRYDAVLMDIQMPVMDGYTATREIRRIEEPRLARIPIVAMTANAFRSDVEKCLEIGMDGHLSKPIDMEALAGTLAKCMAKGK